MAPTPEKLYHAIRITGDFIRNVHLKRTLEATDNNPHLNFWRIMYGNLMDMAVIEWCKLFGSDHDDHQPIHWKKMIPSPDHENFRHALYKQMQLDKETFEKVWIEMKGYRDNQAAHFNLDWLAPEKKPTYPVFDAPLEAAYVYYDYLLQMLKEQGITDRYPLDIRDYSKRFADQAQKVAAIAMTATKELKEVVR
jgi:hypothetical protein